MSANDEYDDLDDLLGDAGIQDDILSRPPGSAKDASANEPKDKPVAEKSSPAGKDGAPRENIETKESKPAKDDADVDISKLKLDEEEPDDAFAQQLKGGVDDLLKETQGDPETQKLIESLIGSLQQSAGPETKAKEDAQPAASAPPSFEDTISATMNRLNESQRPDPEDQNGTDFMERMLRELQNSASAGDGGGLEDILSNMMSELSSKEVLYEPLKDMHVKFPEWFATKGDQLGDADLKRYKKQQVIVAEIVEAYEAPGYSDDNSKTRDFITAKMEEMQNTGAPPEDLVGDIAGGSLLGGGVPDLGGDMPPMPSECATQ